MLSFSYGDASMKAAAPLQVVIETGDAVNQPLPLFHIVVCSADAEIHNLLSVIEPSKLIWSPTSKSVPQFQNFDSESFCERDIRGSICRGEDLLIVWLDNPTRRSSLLR